MFGFDVKICGLSTAESIEAALARGATHIGFVHFAKSPRHLELEEMRALREIVADRAETVVVTVDPSDELVERFAADVAPHWLQLHGHETPARVAEIGRKTKAGGIKIMKSLPVSQADDLAALGDFSTVADRILLDSRRPAGSDLPGGNGVAFDWTLLTDLDPPLPIMLSGGLDAGNVGFALRIARPAGVDISSGVESRPGVKDIGRIHQFFDALDRFAEPAGKALSS